MFHLYSFIFLFNGGNFFSSLWKYRYLSYLYFFFFLNRFSPKSVLLPLDSFTLLLYWVGQKVHLGFSIICYKNTLQTIFHNILQKNPSELLWPTQCFTLVIFLKWGSAIKKSNQLYNHMPSHNLLFLQSV